MRYLGSEVCLSPVIWIYITDNPSFCRWSFNLTLLIAGVFGFAAGGSPDFVTLASLIAVVGVGVGGTFTKFHDESCIEPYCR